jgi:hypothetical protein
MELFVAYPELFLHFLMIFTTSDLYTNYDIKTAKSVVANAVLQHISSRCNSISLSVSSAGIPL